MVVLATGDIQWNKTVPAQEKGDIGVNKDFYLAGAVEDLSADNLKVALLPVCILSSSIQLRAFAFLGAEVSEGYTGPWNQAPAAPGQVWMCHCHRGNDDLWQASAWDKALSSHSLWFSEHPVSWDCSGASSASRVTLRAFVCKKRPETMNLYFILNANQNMIGYILFTHANMLSHWLLDFYAVTKRQNIVYLHMLGYIACCDSFHQSMQHRSSEYTGQVLLEARESDSEKN